MTASRRHSVALEDSHGAVKDYFIVVTNPGCAPEKKRPPTPTADGADRMLLELARHRPLAKLTLIRLTWDDDLWLDDGHQTLVESALLGGLDLLNGDLATLRFREGGTELWVRKQGERRAKKAGRYDSSHAAIRAAALLATP